MTLHHLRMNSVIIAAIDIGTNSGRLLVAKVHKPFRLKMITRFRVPLRLGRRIDPDTQRLDQKAIDDTVDALISMKNIALSCKPDHIDVVCTHAIRSCANSSEVLEQLQRKTQLNVRIIPGTEEAHLSGLGMIHGLQLKGRVLGVDVGGGSTDISLFVDKNPEALFSIPLGVVSLSFSGESREQQEKRIHTIVETAAHDWQQLDFDVAACCSGSAKTLAFLHHTIVHGYSPRHVIGYKLSLQDIEQVIMVLQDVADPRTIAKRWNLDYHRSTLALAGALIFAHLGKIFGVKEWIVSHYGIREGMIFDRINLHSAR
jgi:exopolyphosphatase/guanosine-5'-triphosphate,3'-diphosphate pyrophosphatase